MLQCVTRVPVGLPGVIYKIIWLDTHSLNPNPLGQCGPQTFWRGIQPWVYSVFWDSPKQCHRLGLGSSPRLHAQVPPFERDRQQPAISRMYPRGNGDKLYQLTPILTATVIFCGVTLQFTLLLVHNWPGSHLWFITCWIYNMWSKHSSLPIQQLQQMPFFSFNCSYV